MYGVAAALVVPGALTFLFAANILVAGWRTSAAVDAVGRTHPGRAAVAGSAAVLILVVGIPHLAAANAILAAQGFLDETFAAANPTSGPGTAAVETPAPEFTEPPEETESPPRARRPARRRRHRRRRRRRPRRPSPRTPRTAATARSPRSGPRCPGSAPIPEQPWGDDGRFDLLLIGSDAGSGAGAAGPT